MHFCFTGQYTPQALNGMMDNPTANRFEAAKNVIEAAGGKLISMYGMPADGPGVMVIFETPIRVPRRPFPPWSSPRADSTMSS
jgi:uncharacterized protein with GYD domain